jgi:hypothetical protein
MANAIPYFKGRVLLSFRGFSMLLFIFFTSFIYVLLVRGLKDYTLIFYTVGYLLAIGTIIFYYGWQMCYFGISDKHLIIRNSIFFWWRRTILLTDIKSIRIDMITFSRPTRTYGPYYLRVYFDGLKTQKFYAGTLSGRKWALLAEELERKEIRAINTAPYVPFREML